MYSQYRGARQMPKGRPLGSEEPDLKIMEMIPADGTPIALAKIRKKATGIPYRMSASTLTNCLKELTEAGKLRRAVDASGGRPHYVYNRTLVPPAGKVVFDDWFKPRLLLLKLMIQDTMSWIIAHPHADLDQALHGTMLVFLKASIRADLADFQKLVRSGRMTKMEALNDETRIRSEWAHVLAVEVDETTPTSP
jgi:hypothetical protein